MCTITRPGQADVVFNHLAHAIQAVEQYNGRELDGYPMQVSLVTPISDEDKMKVDKTNVNFGSAVLKSNFSR